MRVLIDYRPALRGRSGAGEYTHELAAALIARSAAGGCGKVEISLFSSSWKDRLTLAPELAGVTPIDLRIPVAVLNLAWHRLGWPSAEMLTGRAFDVTHSSHPLILPARAAAQVVTIHDLDFLSHPEHTRAEIRRDYPALARRHARRADVVIVPSRFTAGEVERLLDVSPGRIAVCPPGAPDWSPRIRAPRDGYLLFLGTLEPRENVGLLLDAYERLLETRKDTRFAGGGTLPELVLAGRATPAAESWLARLAKPPLAGHARHIGYVEPDERRALYEGARLLVLPSLDEGFGIPVLEAMTAGVPVVASRRGALPEVLDGAGVLVDPLDATDLAAGLARILDDAPFTAACVTHGLARAGAYRWTDTAARVCDAYHRAIAHRAPPRGTHRRMRIGIDARELCGHATGVGRYLAGLLTQWSSDDRARRHEFVLYAPEDLNLALDARHFATRLVAGPPGTWWEQVRLPALAGRDHLDVFFAPGYTTALRFTVPTVVAIHDVSFAAHPEWFTAREGLRRRWLTYQSAKRAQRVLTISEFSRRELVERLGVPGDRISVIPPGLTSPLTPSLTAARIRPGASVLYVGSVFNRRHVPDLVRAFAPIARAHAGATLDMIGDDRTHPRENLKGAIAHEGLDGRAHWQAYVSDADLRALYGSARAFAFLSEYEGLGLTPLEAMGAGVPAVLLDTAVARESCRDAALYVPHGDVPAVTRALEQLLFDERTRERLLAAAPAVLARYDWRRAASETLAEIERAG